MEKISKQTVVFLSVFLFASTGWCIMVGSTDVGGVDTFLGSSVFFPNSSPTSEENWVNSILDPDVDFDTKIEPVPYFATNTTNIYAFRITPTPPVTEYFIIKNSTLWALFENNVEHDWGVFDTTDVPGGMNLPDLTSLVISHVSRFDGDTPTQTAVPEPATMFLLGAGLVGMAGVGRKRFKK